MDVEASYFSVSWFFNSWVRLMEYPTRQMEVSESAQLGPRRLVVSPPTDAGLPLLARANTAGKTDLLCFSRRIEEIASDFRARHEIGGLTTLVEQFFKIPVADKCLSVVYANCLFDFCAEEDLDAMLREIGRVLEPDGILFAVYMEHPSKPVGRLWAWAFDRLAFISNGCHPVAITNHLTRNGFRIRKDVSAARLGFPARYTVAELASKSTRNKGSESF